MGPGPGITISPSTSFSLPNFSGGGWSSGSGSPSSSGSASPSSSRRILVEEERIDNTEAEVNTPQYLDESDIPLPNSKALGASLGTGAQSALAISSVAVLASSVSSLSFVFLAKLIQFLEFISYLALISAPHTEYIKGLLDGLFNIVHFDLIPNFNEYIFKPRPNAEAYSIVKSRYRDLEIGNFIYSNGNWEFLVLTLIFTIFFTLGILRLFKKIGKNNKLLNSLRLTKLKFSLVTINVNEYLFFIAIAFSTLSTLQRSSYTSTEENRILVDESEEKEVDNSVLWNMSLLEIVSMVICLLLLASFIKEMINYIEILNFSTNVNPDKEFDTKISKNLKIGEGANVKKNAKVAPKRLMSHRKNSKYAKLNA